MPNAATAQIIGHMVADPEAKEKVTRFRVAVNQGWGDKKTVGWYGVACFGKTAEFVTKYLKKGNAVFVAGELEMQEWVGKDGHKNISPDIRASTVQSLEKKKDDKESGPDPF